MCTCIEGEEINDTHSLACARTLPKNEFLNDINNEQIIIIKK